LISRRTLLARLLSTLLLSELDGCQRDARKVGRDARDAEHLPSDPSQAERLSPNAGPQRFATPRFTEVTERSGIRWVHNPCRTGHKYLPETVGGGGGFIDYDNDGWLDVILVSGALVNGAPLPGYQGPIPRALSLYHNNRDGTFTDVTARVGLKLNEYGLGLAVGDYDNDGWPDLYVTCLGRSHLFHNEHGRFVDVTAHAGVGAVGFATAAAWIDYDRDGKLDLFVVAENVLTNDTPTDLGGSVAFHDNLVEVARM